MKCDCCKRECNNFIISRLYENNIFKQENNLCKDCTTIQKIYMAERCRSENPLLYKEYLKTASEHLKRDLNIEVKIQ